MEKILILETDSSFLSSLSDFLREKGYLISLAQNIERAETLLSKSNFDLFLSERFLSDGDVLELLERLFDRKLFMRTLIFASNQSIFNRIAILKLANDFISKPFNLMELHLKIKNLLSLQKIEDSGFIENTSLLLKDSVPDSCGNYFRPQELKILDCLFKHKDMVVSYETISAYVWGYKEQLPLKKTINVYIRRIRSKLAPYKLMIKTIKNRGYKLIKST
jgi:DNA-binding response OmpR family regulator